MKAQHTPIRVSLPAGESLRDPDTRIEKVSIGDGSFLPPNQTFAERNISPRYGNTLILSALGFTATSIANLYNLKPSAVSTHHYRLREKVEMPSITASSRAVFALGATVLKYGNPVIASPDQLNTLEQISHGFGYSNAALALSEDQQQPFAECTIRQHLMDLRTNNNGERSNLLITRSILSGQIHVDGTVLPAHPAEQNQSGTHQQPIVPELPHGNTSDTPNADTQWGGHQLHVWVPNNVVAPTGEIVIGGYTQTVPVS